MAEPKTQRNDGNVIAFLASVADPQRRADAEAACALMTEVTGEPPVMWGTAIVGFGTREVRYADGRTADWLALGLSPRKQHLALYLHLGGPVMEDLLSRLGPHSLGKGCLYLKRLDAVDQDVLRAVVAESARATRADQLPPS